MARLGALAGLCIAACALAVLAPAAAGASTKTVTLRSKPFVLSGFKTIFPKVDVRTPRRTGYVTRMSAWLVDARGRRVSIRSVMLHHIVFINRGAPGAPRKRSSCSGRGSEPFWGTGEEKQPLMLPPGYGYKIARGERWRMQAMLMSHDISARTVRVEYRMRVVTGKRLQRVKPLWLRANGCSKHPSYDVGGGRPPGSVHSKEHLWKMPISGRIVAASAHLHGSSFALTIKQRRCGDRTLVDHRPLYGHPDDIVYRAKPVLHEPGPIATGHYLSPTGIAVRKGERLKVTGLYDFTRPHPQVMAISHVYVAPDRKAPRACVPLPEDGRIVWTRKDGRSAPPIVNVPLHGIGADGKVVEIERPPGDEQVVSAPTTTVRMTGSRFVPANLSVGLGTKVVWRFGGASLHNVTLASGPQLIGTPNLGEGRRYARTMLSPGTYKFFCYLHPITMTQVISVRP